MGISREPKYSEEKYLDIADELCGVSTVLEDSVNDYVGSVDSYVNDEISDYDLKRDIDSVVFALENVYDSLDSFDDFLEDENLVARIKQDGDCGVCDLEENYSRITDGLFGEVDEFEDFLTVMHFFDESDSEADFDYIRSSSDVSAPTRMLADRGRIQDVNEVLDLSYDRIVCSEKVLRDYDGSKGSDGVFVPEPPVFRLLNESDYPSRVRNLNKSFRKA